MVFIRSAKEGPMSGAVTKFNAKDEVRVTNESVIEDLGRPFTLDALYKVIEVREVQPPGPQCSRWWDAWEDEPRSPRTSCWGKEKYGTCHCEENYECYPHQQVLVRPILEDGSLWEGDSGSPLGIQISGEHITKVS